MRFKALHRTILAAMLIGGLAATAFSQIRVPAPPPLPGLDVRITASRPPAVRYERRSPRPGPDYVWVAGFWHWDGGRWDWVPGRWEQPAVPDAYWIAPRYVHSEGSYIYEPGHWSNQTVMVGEDVRGHRAWRGHEREHERELEREHDRNHYRDRDEDRDRDRDRR